MVEQDGQLLRCHVPDPGRLKELLIPGHDVLLRKLPTQATMKTAGSVVGVYHAKLKLWVSLDSQLANRFVADKWNELPTLSSFVEMRREVTFGASRLDFVFYDGLGQEWLAEVKTVTLVRESDKTALFPDAPTKRGTRHIKELTEGVRAGKKGLVVFVVPREDATGVSTNRTTDIDFHDAVAQATKTGVTFLCLRCNFSPEGLLFEREIPFVQ